VYNEGAHPKGDFQTLVTRALGKLKDTVRTQVPLPLLGTCMVRHRKVGDDRIMLALGGGEPNEAMSTLGLAPRTAKIEDDEKAVDPPATRAFKLYDMYCLIAGDDLVVCLDHVRLQALERYLANLLDKAGLPAKACAFELMPVANKTQQEVLDAEGVNSIHVRSALYAASAGDGDARGVWNNLKNGLRDVFRTALPDPRQRDVLAERLGDVNVELVIKASGGTRAETIVLEGMQAAGQEMLEELDDAASRVSVVTRRGTHIRADEIVLSKYVGIPRLSNALDYNATWDALRQYEQELRDADYWQS
jgi:hypothetical protein